MVTIDDPSPIMRAVARYKSYVILGALAALIGVSSLFTHHVGASPIEEIADARRASTSMQPTVCALDDQMHAATGASHDNAITAKLCADYRERLAQEAFADALGEYVAGHPIEQMTEQIAQLDPKVAAYMVAMAKQESNWGKRVPVLNGEDCFNYWGFRAKRERMGSGGHTCFDSREDAVETVAKRVHELVYDYERETPREMLIWKCGRSCASHNPAGVERWVNVVSRYYTDVIALREQSA